MPITAQGYIAPDPTPEQIENAKNHNFDPWDRCGSLPWWDFAADDTLAAAGLIHDELSIRGGTLEERIHIDSNFARDAMLCALSAKSGYFKQKFEILKAHACAEIVDEARRLGKYWHEEDWNTPLTRAQSDAQLHEAFQWMNVCASQINEPLPYPTAGFPVSVAADPFKVMG